jgi:cytochrome oxidase Cu insertion factor (SCO1/SenC/PrrC family)
MKKIAVILTSLLIVILAGCTQNNHYTVKLTAPRTFTPGKPCPIQIKVTDTAGKLVTGAKVSGKLNMKLMDHGTVPIKLEEIDHGKYLGTANLSMAGDWVADIKIAKNGKTFEQEKSFSIAVKTAENAHQVNKNVTLPDFTLRDQNGTTVTREGLLGKTVIMTFTYVNCADPNACPILLGNFRNLQQDLQVNRADTSNLMLVSVSVDPENDTPAVLKEHAKEMNFDLSYLKMLTGNLSEVQKLANAVGEHFNKQGAEVMHDNKTFIFNPQGKLTYEFTGSYIDRNELYQVVTSK